jgi:hypothetical protein
VKSYSDLLFDILATTSIRGTIAHSTDDGQFS